LLWSARGLQALRQGSARPRAAGDHRAGGEPYLRSAPLVSARATCEAGIEMARLLRLERHGRKVRRHAHHFSRYRDLELDVGPGGESLLLAPLLLASA